jgi:Icc-related predicted phosphoesterase
MRIATTADLHGHLPVVPACDVLVIAGDVTPTADHDVAFQARWLDTEFRAWLDAAPARAVVGIAGNHDFVFERAPELVPDDLPWTYLEDSAATIVGVRFWGSPWTPWFFDWAFNAPKGEDGERFLAERYAGVPPDTDVLVIHGPPAGYGDLTARGMTVGSTAQLELVRRVAPALNVYGHIHEGRGSWRLGPTQLVNASAVDLQYQLHDEPIVVYDIDG